MSIVSGVSPFKLVVKAASAEQAVVSCLEIYAAGFFVHKTLEELHDRPARQGEFVRFLDLKSALFILKKSNRIN